MQLGNPALYSQSVKFQPQVKSIKYLFFMLFDVKAMCLLETVRYFGEVHIQFRHEFRPVLTLVTT
jgi:hypothetical protein